MIWLSDDELRLLIDCLDRRMKSLFMTPSLEYNGLHDLRKRMAKALEHPL